MINSINNLQENQEERIRFDKFIESFLFLFDKIAFLYRIVDIALIWSH